MRLWTALRSAWFQVSWRVSTGLDLWCLRRFDAWTATWTRRTLHRLTPTYLPLVLCLGVLAQAWPVYAVNQREVGIAYAAPATPPIVRMLASASSTMPYGIPTPAFGLTQTRPSLPAPWTSEVPGFYYVDPTAPGATDANTYGYQTVPRLTIPRTSPPSAGAVVYLATTTYATAHTGGSYLHDWNGTAESPIYLTGASSSSKATITKSIEWRDSSYVIFENIAHTNADDNVILGLFSVDAALHHFVIRACTFTGNDLMNTTEGIGLFGVTGNRLHHILIWNNTIQDCGDWELPDGTLSDVHGIAWEKFVDDVWIIDNTITRCLGNGVQVGAGTNGSSTAADCCHRIYIGRNTVSLTQQDGLWSKQGTDVIFSQNIVHDIRRDSATSARGCIGFQYSPETCWIVFNLMYTAQSGTVIASGGGFGTVTYHGGNVIRDIHDTEGEANFANSSNTAGICISCRDSGLTYRFFSNTLSDYDGGLYAPDGIDNLSITSSIWANRNTAVSSYDVWLVDVTGSTFSYNLVENTRIQWTNQTYTTITSLQTAQVAATHNLGEQDPMFANEATDDLNLQSISPCLNTGTADAAYATFLSLYGLDIAVDFDGTTRPQELAFDQGAYERSGPAPPPPVPANTPGAGGVPVPFGGGGSGPWWGR